MERTDFLVYIKEDIQGFTTVRGTEFIHHKPYRVSAVDHVMIVNGGRDDPRAAHGAG